MTRTAKATVVLVVVAMAALIGWDIYVATNDVRGDTISEIFLFTASTHPSLVMAFGVLIGHLTWPREDPIFWRKPHTAILLGSSICVLLAVEMFVSIMVLPIAPLLVGIPLGHWLWPQKSRVMDR